MVKWYTINLYMNDVIVGRYDLIVDVVTVGLVGLDEMIRINVEIAHHLEEFINLGLG